MTTIAYAKPDLLDNSRATICAWFFVAISFFLSLFVSNLVVTLLPLVTGEPTIGSITPSGTMNISATLTGFFSSWIAVWLFTWSLIAGLRSLMHRNRAGIIYALVLGFILVAMSVLIFVAMALAPRGIDFDWLLAVPQVLILLAAVGCATFAVAALLRRHPIKREEISGRRLMHLWYLEDVLLFSPAFVSMFTLVGLIVPRFIEIFREFRTELPAITEYVVVLHGFIREVRMFSVVIFTIITFVAPVALLLFRLMRPPVAGQRRRILWPLAGAIAFFFTVNVILLLAIMLPIHRFTQSVTGGE